MAKLTLRDFYYGSFISCLLNSKGIKPSLFDDTPSRRIFKIATDKTKEDYLVFTKYVLARPNKTTKYQHWIFTFTPEEINELKKYAVDFHNIRIALICVTKDLKESEVALLKKDICWDALGIDKKITSERINIKLPTNAKQFRIYGSGRSDFLDAKDNTLKVGRDCLKGL